MGSSDVKNDSPGTQSTIDRAVESAVVRSVFGLGVRRREFLRLVGAAGAVALIEEVFPLAAAKALV